MSKSKYYKVKVEVTIDFELDNEGKKTDKQIIKNEIKGNPPFCGSTGADVDDGYFDFGTRDRIKILSIERKGRR